MVNTNGGHTSQRNGRTRANASLSRFGACVTNAPESANVKKENSTTRRRSQDIAMSPRKKSASCKFQTWPAALLMYPNHFYVRPTPRWSIPRPPVKFTLSAEPSDEPCDRSTKSKYWNRKFILAETSFSKLWSLPPVMRKKPCCSASVYVKSSIVSS